MQYNQLLLKPGRKKLPQLLTPCSPVVCYTAVFSVVGEERCVTTLKNDCVADNFVPRVLSYPPYEGQGGVTAGKNPGNEVVQCVQQTDYLSFWGEGSIFYVNSKFDLVAYLTFPVLRSSPFESLGDVNNKDPCEVIAETAVILCILLLISDILILFLAYQEITSPVFQARSHCPQPSFYTFSVHVL